MKTTKTTKLTVALLSLVLIIQSIVFLIPASAENTHTQTLAEPQFTGELDCISAVLMEESTGKVLYAKEQDKPLPPASVTKVMTLLLCMEAIDSGRIKLSDTVTASAHATSMGGSQVYLKEGEQMTVEDMIKSVVIASANDCAVALAEHIAGSEESFVKCMNDRAKELSMKNTHFENTNGLDDTAVDHVTSALDIAIMSRELIKHKKILEYSSIWMDSIRGGAFGLTNTNRLVRFYKGCTGLKTGSTSKAKFCISATAKRDGMGLICVIMGAPSRDVRNAAAVSLLDFGFANFGLFSYEGGETGEIKVKCGKTDSVKGEYQGFSVVLPKENAKKVECVTKLPEYISAPVKKGDKIGSVEFRLGEEIIGEVSINSKAEIGKMTYFDYFFRVIKRFLLM